MSAKFAQKVFIANFGHENYLWPDCLKRAAIATFQDEDLQSFWLAGDRAGYIAHCLATKKTSSGITPIAPVAGRWFNLATELASTEGDVWIHREKDEIWWTISRADEMEASLEPAYKPKHPGERVYVLRKPTTGWSNKNKSGILLTWAALHPKAREFLFTEATFQQLRGDNPDYALALIEGDDLQGWHKRSDWKAKEDKAGRGAARTFDAAAVTAVNLAKIARATVAASNGQQVLRTVKNKDLRFAPTGEFEKYIEALLRDQEGRCAITGIEMQYFGREGDSQLLCSLDRINSDGHYEPGNLQIVCRFVNKWKSDTKDDEFRRLLALVRNNGDPG
ncbi:hypothetical protein WME76_22720 [Sorangium sp. So ce119]|uniref:hypothetical protein n=1 Tax=Sorangium sp. So ce119 TaxID=3133279 RepID=UPI003F607B14